MNEILNRMLARYNPVKLEDHIRALREILQELALLGLWRIKFFNKAAFYGGTALRLLYGLDRFSEDLDFSLLKPFEKFDFQKYLSGLNNEIMAFGFETKIDIIKKDKINPIKSAFLKDDTLKQFLVIQTNADIMEQLPKGQSIKIKIEVDTNPPEGFNTETKFMLQPVPFPVRIYSLPDLFAGKMHAVLCRRWKNRVKGRDWYDLIWYAANYPELHLSHLEMRMKQTGHLKENQILNKKLFLSFFNEAVKNLDIRQAKKEVEPFIKDPLSLQVWSKDFFLSLGSKIELI